MKRILFSALLLACTTCIAPAIPQSFFGGGFIGPIIPAHPRFGKNLTGDFLRLANWQTGELPGPWESQTALPGQTVQHMTAMPVLFGAVPDSVVAYGESGMLQEISITYLDAGSFFGFKLGGEKTHTQRSDGSALRMEFESHYLKLERELRRRLESGCGRGQPRPVGRSSLLRTVFIDYPWEDFVIRLAARQGHSVGLSIFRKGEAPTDFLTEAITGLDRRERANLLQKNVRHPDRGGVTIEDLPYFQQGNTPFCGIHSLAMAGHYLGLRISPKQLEASAQLRNTGSARGSRMFDLYKAVAEELGMRVSTSTKFDPKRVRQSIEAGIPVVVWRRVSEEREQAHTQFVERLKNDPHAVLPEPTPKQRQSWPARDRKGSPSHGSVVSGINQDRSEVVFSEPWGEHGRDRRMRIEEMQATAYTVFYFKF